MDPLAFTPAELEELLADACRKAYRKGVKAATRKFDTLLSRHYRRHQLESLNGTTGDFVEEAREQLKSLTIFKRRDATGHDHAADGTFAPKGGGGEKQNGNTASAKEGAGAKGVAAKPGAGDAAPAQHDAPTEEHLLDGLHEVVPAGQWHRVKAAVTRAGQKVYERMVLATPAFLKLQHVLTTIEGPDDLKQFGYKPMLDGTAGHDTPDAFADATGVGGTLGAKLAAHVLTKVVFWLKDRAGLAKAMHDGDHFAEAAEALADIFAVLAEEFGGEAPDAKTVEDALRNLDGDHDPHAGAAVALIDHALAAAEAGEDVQPGLDRIVDLLDGGDGEEEVEKAFDESKHPRDDNGRFVSRDAIADAKGDPAKEAELRKRVTDPEQRKKLDAALGGESDLGRTKRGQARADAAERRKTRQASKEKATEVLRRIRANGEVTADDVRDLADHLPALTVAELRLHREALMAKLGGKRVKDQYVQSLVEHARGKVPGKPKAGGKPRRPVVSDTIVAAVRRLGGIDPDSLAFRGHYSGVREATEDNVPLSIFRRGGSGLDELAQEMQAEGLITVPDGEHPSEYLLDLIRARAHTHAADLSAQYEDALDEHYRLLEEESAARGPGAEEALRLGREAGASAFASGAGEEGFGDAGERGGAEEDLTGDDGGDTSFDFGYNAAGDDPSEPPPTDDPTTDQSQAAPAAVGPGEDDERMTFADRASGGKAIEHEGRPLRSGDLLVEKIPDHQGGGERLVSVAHAHRDYSTTADGRPGDSVNVRSSADTRLSGFKRGSTERGLSFMRRATAEDVRRLAAESGIDPPAEYLDPSRLAAPDAVPADPKPAAPDAATDVAPAAPAGDTPPAPTGEKPMTAKPKTKKPRAAKPKTPKPAEKPAPEPAKPAAESPAESAPAKPPALAPAAAKPAPAAEKPRPAAVPAGHEVVHDHGGGALVTKDRAGELTTRFPEGEPERQAKRLAGAVAATMDDASLVSDDGMVTLGWVVADVRRRVPDATDADVMAALSHLRGKRLIQGHSLNEVQRLTDGKSSVAPVGGGKDMASATLWDNGRAVHYWTLAGGSPREIAKLADA